MSQRQIARQLRCNQRTVRRTIRRYQQRKSILHRPRTGRPRATTPRNDAYLRATVRRRHVTARTVLAEWQTTLNHVVSVSTVRRRYVMMSRIAQRQNEPLQSPFIIKLLMTLSHQRCTCGVNGRIAKRKPLTNRRIRAARRRWAARVQDWTVDRNWRHVVFSDEFHVTLFECDCKTIVWWQGGERYDPACLNPQRSQSSASLMFWGCIGFWRAGHLVKVQGHMDRHNYIDILQQHPQPTGSDIFGHQNPNFVFQQDDAPPHTARDTVAWVYNQGF